MGTKNETIEEMLARFEEEDKKFEEMQNDPAYDGESPSLTEAEELEFYRERSLRNKDDILKITSIVLLKSTTYPLNVLFPSLISLRRRYQNLR